MNPLAQLKPNTQAAIARSLGLSQTTVSNALNGRRELCTAETYERIWNYAVATGYRGRGLVKDASPVSTQIEHVGVILGGSPDDDEVSAALAAARTALESTLAARGVACMALGRWDQPYEKLLRAFSQKEGAPPVLVALGEMPLAALKRLHHLVPRLVTAGSFHPELGPGVLGDHEQAAELLIEHLADTGHGSATWLGFGVSPEITDAVTSALANAAARRGVKLQTIEGLAGTESRDEAGRLGAKHFLRQMIDTPAGHATAVICADRLVAEAAMATLQRAGISVPGEVSVVVLETTLGVGATATASPLTICGAAASRSGATAAGLALEYPLAHRGRFACTRLPAVLHTGASSGPACNPQGRVQPGTAGRVRLVPLPPNEPSVMAS